MQTNVHFHLHKIMLRQGMQSTMHSTLPHCSATTPGHVQQFCSKGACGVKQRASAVHCHAAKAVVDTSIDVSAARRTVLSLVAVQSCLGVAAHLGAAHAKPASGAGDWTSPGLAAPEDPDIPKFFKTASGVKVQELTAGNGGAAVAPASKVLLDYVLRRANGYFIYATVEGVSFQPKDIPVGPVVLELGNGTVVPGLEEALQGMTPGAKRRILVPPELGYVDQALLPQPPGFAAKRQVVVHSKEPLLFEVQVLRVLS